MPTTPLPLWQHPARQDYQNALADTLRKTLESEHGGRNNRRMYATNQVLLSTMEGMLSRACPGVDWVIEHGNQDWHEAYQEGVFVKGEVCVRSAAKPHNVDGYITKRHSLVTGTPNQLVLAAECLGRKVRLDPARSLVGDALKRAIVRQQIFTSRDRLSQITITLNQQGWVEIRVPRTAQSGQRFRSGRASIVIDHPKPRVWLETKAVLSSLRKNVANHVAGAGFLVSRAEDKTGSGLVFVVLRALTPTYKGDRQGGVRAELLRHTDMETFVQAGAAVAVVHPALTVGPQRQATLIDPVVRAALEPARTQLLERIAVDVLAPAELAGLTGMSDHERQKIDVMMRQADVHRAMEQHVVRLQQQVMPALQTIRPIGGGRGVLTPQQEREAAALWSAQTFKAIGARFGVSRNVIAGLYHRRHWPRKDVLTAPPPAPALAA